MPPKIEEIFENPPTEEQHFLQDEKCSIEYTFLKTISQELGTSTVYNFLHIAKQAIEIPNFDFHIGLHNAEKQFTKNQEEEKNKKKVL